MSFKLYDLPPGANGGTAEQQLADLRNYLTRMVRTLNTAENADATTGSMVVTNTPQGVVASPGSSVDAQIEVIRQQAATLKGLIVKTADEVYSFESSITATLQSDYVAQSEFGTYKQNVTTTINATAARIEEIYDYTESVESELENYMTHMQGQIRRGYLDVNGVTYFGIAVANKLEFTGTTMEDQGETYYELDGASTLGLYTDSGWYFFINGVPVGWFSSQDGMLHVANIMVDDTIQMGNWMISTAGGWGIRYVG